jgi:hypothetical protein
MHIQQTILSSCDLWGGYDKGGQGGAVKWYSELGHLVGEGRVRGGGVHH